MGLSNFYFKMIFFLFYNYNEISYNIYNSYYYSFFINK